MIQSFWVPGPLPGTNEIVDAAKSGQGKAVEYSRMKAKWTNDIALQAKSQRLKPCPGAVSLTCFWKEPDARRDPDNIHAGLKFVLDGLVTAGILLGDSRRYVRGVAHATITTDKKNPGVTVQIQDVPMGRMEETQ